MQPTPTLRPFGAEAAPLAWGAENLVKSGWNDNGFALGKTHVTVDDVLIDKAVFAGKARHHRRDENSVRQSEAVDLGWRK